jgi:hypothetical protein
LSETFFSYFFHVHLSILDKVVSSLYANFGTPCIKIDIKYPNKTKCRINFGMLNIRTLLPSTQLLSEIIEEREIDIMSLTETNFNEDTPNENISIENYNIIRVDRDLNFSNKIKGGGVLLYRSLQSMATVKYLENGFSEILEIWSGVKSI